MTDFFGFGVRSGLCPICEKPVELDDGLFLVYGNNQGSRPYIGPACSHEHLAILLHRETVRITTNGVKMDIERERTRARGRRRFRPLRGWL